MTARLLAAIAAAKCYPPIEDVAGVDYTEYDETAPLNIGAYDSLVEVSHEIGALYLTSEQTLALESRLAQARADVDAAQDGPPAETFTAPAGPSARCEVCCSPIEPETAVASWVDMDSWIGSGRQVVAHAGRCPEPGQQAVSPGRALNGDAARRVGITNTLLVRVKDIRRG